VHILSGDSEGSVQKLGQNLGIPSYCLHSEKTAT
jgi:cation transport ATPase